MATSKYIKNENAVSLALGFNVNQPIPLDARLVVTEYSGLTQASSGDNVFYDGIVVSVVDDKDATKNGLYQLIHMPPTDINNWHKIATATEVENIKIETANEVGNIKEALSSVKVNGVSGVTSENGINFTISGDSIYLGENYDGESNDESPSSGDTVNEAIKKIIGIIIKNKNYAKVSVDDLNNRITALSGDVITNVSLDNSSPKLIITKNGKNEEIQFDTEGDANHNVKFNIKVDNGQAVIQGSTSLDSGEYDNIDEIYL